MPTVVIDPVTRIEGHLRFEADIVDGSVTDARSSGQLYRGFEQILKGRHPYDAYHLTQRFCGVCPVAHATASIRALEMAYGLTTPDIPQNARLIRNLIIAANTVMSHATHFYVLWAPDLVNPMHREILTRAGAQNVYNVLGARFTPFSGTSWTGAVQTRKILHEIIAILGGKMPHHMTFVPGGVTVTPNIGDLERIYSFWLTGKDFIETQVLGCSVERWLENRSLADVLAWVNESESHALSDLGLLVRYGGPVEEINLGLHTYGGYSGSEPIGLLSVGLFYEGDTWGRLKSGYTDGISLKKTAFDPDKISEHIRYSWFEGYSGGKHPYEGETRPDYAPDSDRYSWLKAPRYDGTPAEVGPLARMINDEDPLVSDLAEKLGINIYTRTLARLHETVRLFAMMPGWAFQLIDRLNEGFTKPSDFSNTPKVPDKAEGYGLTEAPRGALGHWIRIRDGKIERYQAVVSTTWNLSPRDSNGYRGPAEQAAMGTRIPDAGNPVQLGSVVRSFDPCIACAVHTIDQNTGKKYEIRVL